jgi:poly(U)-specific endoribonuclease
MDFLKKLAQEAVEEVVDHVTKEIKNLNVGGQDRPQQDGQQQQDHDERPPHTKQQQQQHERPPARQEQEQEQEHRPQPAASRPAPAPAGGVPKPTEAELRDLSAACQKLWDLDVNRIHVGEKIKLNLQVGRLPAPAPRLPERGQACRLVPGLFRPPHRPASSPSLAAEPDGGGGRARTPAGS